MNEEKSVSPPLYVRVQQEQIDLQIPDVATALYFREKHASFALKGAAQVALEGFSPVSLHEVSAMIPASWWYQREGHEKSIHGEQHSLRVALYAEALGQRMSIDDRARNILRAAALLHDIGRTKDYTDPEHGLRSVYQWEEMEGDLGDVLVNRGIALDAKGRDIVRALCIYHERVYQEIDETAKMDEETHRLLKIFMAADALDRYRAPSEEWWPDEKFFDHDGEVQKHFTELMPLAKYFTLETEYYRLSRPNLSLEEAISHVGQEIGLVQEEQADTLRQGSRRQTAIA